MNNTKAVGIVILSVLLSVTITLQILSYRKEKEAEIKRFDDLRLSLIALNLHWKTVASICGNKAKEDLNDAEQKALFRSLDDIFNQATQAELKSYELKDRKEIDKNTFSSIKDHIQKYKVLYKNGFSECNYPALNELKDSQGDINEPIGKATDQLLKMLHKGSTPNE